MSEVSLFDGTCTVRQIIILFLLSFSRPVESPQQDSDQPPTTDASPGEVEERRQRRRRRWRRPRRWDRRNRHQAVAEPERTVRKVYVRSAESSPGRKNVQINNVLKVHFLW